MTAIPELATDRLRLRAPRLEDFEPYAAFWASDRSIPEGGPKPRRAAWREYAADVAAWQLRGFGAWSVEDRGTGAWLGLVGLFQPEEYAEPEIGWTVAPEAEGRGIAFEAARAARDWAFGPRGLVTLVSYVEPSNARSIRLAERLGARLDPDAAVPDPGDLAFRHPRPEAAA
jgi:RimJ/RimL family protein N-acetyltransferase